MANDSLTPNSPESARSAPTAPATDESLECPVCGTRLRHDLDRHALIRDDAPTPGAVEDEGFYCPVCYYNLTGQPSGRCPECGSLFDREQLLQAQVTGEVALMPWDDPDVPSGWPSFWKTTLITCGQPKRFSMAIAVLPQVTRAYTYYMTCVGAMALSLMVPMGVAALAGIRGPDLFPYLTGALVLLVATVIGNNVWPLLLTLAFVHPDGKRRYAPWRSIIQYSCGHLLLYPPIVVTVSAFSPLTLLWFDEARFIPIVTLFFLHCFALGVFALWGLTLDAVLMCRAPGTLSRIIVGTAVLLLGIGIYLGVWSVVLAFF